MRSPALDRGRRRHMAGDDLTVLVGAILDVRRARGDHLAAEMFLGEQAWDMMLHLFVADSRSHPLTGAQLVAQVNCTADVGRRWIKYLTDMHYIVGDGDGRLDDVLTLTPAGLHSIEEWLAVARRRLTHNDRAMGRLQS
jgi:hypothetical protein